jgi:GMP synthase (glutamine-hydrolysing)
MNSIDNIKSSGIIIIDFGSQYTQLIARRVRELNVYSVIVSSKVSQEKLLSYQPTGIILSGGPASVYDMDSPKIPEFIFTLDIPILGICYGMQAMINQLGGEVRPCEQAEYGLVTLNILNNAPLFSKKTCAVWMSHGDAAVSLPKGFLVSATSANTEIAAIYHQTKPWFGLQFHPEVTHTEGGMEILKQFIIKICQSKPNWHTADLVVTAQENIHNIVRNDHVLLGLSGGVDSSALAILLNKSIGARLHPVFVDTGLLRHHEVGDVLKMFNDLNIKIHVIDAAEIFLSKLKNVTCPEKKRKIIGKLFIKIFQEYAKKQKQCKWLAQGTIYPDVIESAGVDYNQLTTVIKSHHNVGGLPRKLGFKLLEPFRELFKDEVRQVATYLGLPDFMIKRHPFPGPGLAVRIAGNITAENIACVRAADHIFMQVLHNHNWYQKLAQAFAVFVPVKTVAVKGDGRKYEAVICLRAVITQDFMTANVATIPYEILLEASGRITNEVPGVSRVLYDISNKPPATIEWE